MSLFRSPHARDTLENPLTEAHLPLSPLPLRLRERRPRHRWPLPRRLHDGAARLVRMAATSFVLALAACAADTPAPPYDFAAEVEVDLAAAPFDLASGTLAVRRDGQWAAMTGGLGNASAVALFDSAGRFHALLGSAGAGPAEYRLITALAFGAGDSLWVFDGENRRLDVYAPGGTTIARSMPYELRVDAAVPDSAAMLVSGSAHGGPQPLLRVERVAGEARTVLLEEPMGAEPHEQLHVAAYDGSVFVARRRAWDVKRIRADGTVDRITNQPPRWWRAGSDDPELSGLVDTEPNILSMALHGGELWVTGAVIVPPADAKAAFDGPDPGAQVATWIRNQVTVFDAGSGRVLREYQANGMPVYLLDDQRAFRWEPAGRAALLDYRLVIGKYGP